MADNYLENHYEEYLKRKADWEKSKKCSFKRTTPKTNVCICGGGNIGHVLAGFLASKDNYRVTILTRQPSKWCSKENLPLIVTDCNGKSYKGLILATDSPELAMKDCNIVFITLPGFAIAEQLKLIAPYVIPKTYIGAVFCSSGFFPMAMKILPQDSKLFGFQRVPFISRLTKYGYSANLLGYRPLFNIATYNIQDKLAITTLLNKMFNTPIKLLDNYMEATLTNSNPLLHPSRLYGMIKGKELPFDRNILFYEEWDNISSQLLIDCDREFQELIKKLQISQSAIPTILDYYESHDADSLTKKIKSIKSFCGIYAPLTKVENGYIPDYTSRYFTEDIPYGLILIKSYAVKYNVSTPKIDSIILWAQENMGKKYLIDGELNGENIDETIAKYIIE